jgi:hypothetical protein
MTKKTIKVGLHGHILPDYGEKWKKKLGFGGRDLADIVFTTCKEANIDLYVLTNEPEFPGYKQKSRHQHVRENALSLARQKRLEYADLGESAFRIKSGNHELTLLDGQSLRIYAKDFGTGRYRLFESLAIGRSGIQDSPISNDYDFPSFEEASKYLKGEGLPSIGEHIFAHGHEGPMDKDQAKKYCNDGIFDALEHNAKLGLSRFWNKPLIPSQISGNTEIANEEVVTLAKETNTPLFANDDSDFPEHVGVASMEFPKDKMDMTNGDTITSSILQLTKDSTYKGPQFKANYGQITNGEAWKYIWLIGQSMLPTW